MFGPIIGSVVVDLGVCLDAGIFIGIVAGRC